MNQNTFQSYLMRTKSLQSLDSERSEFWRGYQRGIRRLYHGKSFGTAEEHEKWMNCADGDYRKQLQDGYHAGFEGLSPDTLEQIQTTTYLLRDIPDELWNRAKHRAVDDGVSLRDLILSAVESYLTN